MPRFQQEPSSIRMQSPKQRHHHAGWRLGLASILVTFTASSAIGIELFHRHWNEYYLSNLDMDDESVQQARRLGCYVCHVKGKRKKSHRNEYGQALEHYLDADDFPEDWGHEDWGHEDWGHEDWGHEHPKEAKRKIIAAFDQGEEDLKDTGSLAR